MNLLPQPCWINVFHNLISIVGFQNAFIFKHIQVSFIEIIYLMIIFLNRILENID